MMQGEARWGWDVSSHSRMGPPLQARGLTLASLLLIKWFNSWLIQERVHQTLPWLCQEMARCCTWKLSGRLVIPFPQQKVDCCHIWEVIADVFRNHFPSIVILAFTFPNQVGEKRYWGLVNIWVAYWSKGSVSLFLLQQVNYPPFLGKWLMIAHGSQTVSLSTLKKNEKTSYFSHFSHLCSCSHSVLTQTLSVLAEQTFDKEIMEAAHGLNHSSQQKLHQQRHCSLK